MKTVTVAGAGAIGLAISLTLARAGVKVTLHDPAPLGDNASGVAAGMLAPAFEAALDPVSAGHFRLLKAARDLWPAFAEQNGLALDRAGALAAGSEAEVEGWARRLEEAGAVVHRLSPVQARALSPGLAEEVGAVFTPEDWRIEPRTTLAALAVKAREAGVRFVQAPATGEEATDLLVVATGASHALAVVAPELFMVTPIKGHILRAPALAGTGAVVRGEGVYVCAGAAGAIVGATMESGVADRAIDPAVVDRLRQRGAMLVPALAEAEVEAATGVRGATPDGLPLVGFSANPRAFLAVGARRNGWLLAPLVARMAAAYLAGEDPGPWRAQLDAQRFSRGDLRP